MTDLTITDLAKKFQVNTRTIRRWLKSGKISPTRTLPSGRVRWTPEDAERLSSGREIKPTPPNPLD